MQLWVHSQDVEVYFWLQRTSRQGFAAVLEAVTPFVVVAGIAGMMMMVIRGVLICMMKAREYHMVFEKLMLCL